MTNTIANLTEKLATLQQTLKAPKDKMNEFGNFNYRNAEDILKAAKEVMPYGCTIITREGLELIGDRYYIKSVSVFTDGDFAIESTGYAREDLAKKGMSDSQVTGSTSSYAKKYSLSNLLMISGESDADTKNNWDREVSAYHDLIKAAQAGSDADCMDVFMFTAEYEVEDKKALYFAYMDKHSMKGQKGKLQAALKGINDRGYSMLEQYRDAMIDEKDQTATEELEQELTTDQLEFVNQMIELKLATGT